MRDKAMEELMKERIEQLINYIMKHCLWQFHSRAWDRERQNQEILTKTKEILCHESVEPTERLDRCYWADAVVLAESYRNNYPWINDLGTAETAALMKGVHERLDYLTITGSLNLELTDQHY
jgi:Fe-only nitrogenase delta subunit